VTKPYVVLKHDQYLRGHAQVEVKRPLVWPKADTAIVAAVGFSRNLRQRRPQSAATVAHPRRSAATSPRRNGARWSPLRHRQAKRAARALRLATPNASTRCNASSPRNSQRLHEKGRFTTSPRSYGERSRRFAAGGLFLPFSFLTLNG
jgi:hypothetical protein